MSLRSIQSLRGVAALLVVITHALGGAGLKFGDTFGHNFYISNLEDMTLSGVDIFFVISGFIMVYVSRRKFGSSAAVPDFIVRRMIRIVPLYWIFSAVILGILIFAPFLMPVLKFGLQHTVESFLFVPTVNSNGEYYPILGVGWTLSYEMYFYLIFAAFLAVSVRASVVLTGLLFATCFALGRWYGASGPMAVMLTDQILIEFVLGEGVCLIFLSGLQPSVKLAACLFALALLFYVLHVLIGPPNIGRLLYRGIPATCLVLSSLWLERAKGFAFPVWLQKLGDSSYSLYLTHTLTISACYKIYAMLHLDNRIQIGVLMLVSIVLAVLCAHIVYLALERPMTIGLVRAWERRGCRQTVPAA